MSKAELKKALVDYYNSYDFCTFCRFNKIDAGVVEEILKTKISNYRGKKTTVISKIARDEGFTAEDTAAFRAGIEKFDVESLIAVIKNHDYEFHPDVIDFEDLGEVLREQLIDDGIIPKWFWRYVDVAQLGSDHILNANEYVFSEYGYFEIF